MLYTLNPYCVDDWAPSTKELQTIGIAYAFLLALVCLWPHILATTRAARLASLPTCQSNDDCVICLAPLKHAAVKLPCGHAFHASCIRRWLASEATCPTCRSILWSDLDLV